MKKVLAILAVLSVVLFGGVALADDPDGDIQQARNLLSQADAILAAEQAKPQAVTTVTETVTPPPVTVTVTVTETATTPPPGPSCTGTSVPPGPGLGAAMSGAPAGTTFCLAAGTYTVDQTINTQAGDRVIGAGRDVTHIDGTGLPVTAVGIFSIGGASYFEALDIFGAPNPTVGSGTTCPGDPSRCGRAFHTGSQALTLQSIDCHDNGSNCVGGGGPAKVVVDDIDCYDNGSNYSMISSHRSAACIKRAAIYSSGGDTTITNSYIHDNPWNGVWCDFCKYGTFAVTGNVFENNGVRAIQWEMSGGWTADDNAIVTDNTFHGNGWRTTDPNNGASVGDRGGIDISTANDILVENNTFGGQASGAYAVTIVDTLSRRQSGQAPDSRGVVVRNNALNGDALKGCGLTGVTCSGNA